jgi:teichoic acid transport system ATP-binding protein
MSENVFELENVSFFYKNLKPFPILDKMFNRHPRTLPTKFRALNNMTFNIEKGKNVGIIGRNGSGKTTLIRLLAGVYGPDEGVLRANSSSISMLALGVGFDGNSSGYDNIYLNALLRGHKRSLVDEKLEEIIDFSEIRDFIFNPVKTYSSGMRMRLAFSIAIHFEPEVLLLDEALAVGDPQFQKKSAERMNELIRNKNRTVVLVSHSISLLQQECERIIWLDSGRIKMIGDADEVLKIYKSTA